MDSSKEMRNKTASEELVNNNKTEGEIKDSTAEGVTGGLGAHLWELPRGGDFR